MCLLNGESRTRNGTALHCVTSTEKRLTCNSQVQAPFTWNVRLGRQVAKVSERLNLVGTPSDIGCKNKTTSWYNRFVSQMSRVELQGKFIHEEDFSYSCCEDVRAHLALNLPTPLFFVLIMERKNYLFTVKKYVMKSGDYVKK